MHRQVSRIGYFRTNPRTATVTRTGERRNLTGADAKSLLSGICLDIWSSAEGGAIMPSLAVMEREGNGCLT